MIPRPPHRFEQAEHESGERRRAFAGAERKRAEPDDPHADDPGSAPCPPDDPLESATDAGQKRDGKEEKGQFARTVSKPLQERPPGNESCHHEGRFGEPRPPAARRRPVGFGRLWKVLEGHSLTSVLIDVGESNWPRKKCSEHRPRRGGAPA